MRGCECGRDELCAPRDRSEHASRTLFTVEGRVVGSTRSRNQRYIGRLMERLAALYVGREVCAVYPEDR